MAGGGGGGGDSGGKGGGAAASKQITLLMTQIENLKKRDIPTMQKTVEKKIADQVEKLKNLMNTKIAMASKDLESKINMVSQSMGDMEIRLQEESPMRQSRVTPAGRDSADSPSDARSYRGRQSAERGDLDLGASLQMTGSGVAAGVEEEYVKLLIKTEIDTALEEFEAKVPSLIPEVETKSDGAAFQELEEKITLAYEMKLEELEQRIQSQIDNGTKNYVKMQMKLKLVDMLQQSMVPKADKIGKGNSKERKEAIKDFKKF